MRSARAGAVPQGISVGHRHLGLSDRRRGQRRRPRPVDLGHLCPYAGQDRRSQQRRPRQRSLSPLQGRRRPDQGARRQGLPVFDRVAAGISGRQRRAKSQGSRFLRPAGRRTAEERYRALCDALSLGSAAGAAGQGRRLAIQRNLEGIRRLRRLCRGAPDRSGQEHLHRQRSRTVREFRLWLGHRRARPQAAGGRAEPGPPQCRARPRARGAGDPRQGPRRASRSARPRTSRPACRRSIRRRTSAPPRSRPAN